MTSINQESIDSIIKLLQEQDPDFLFIADLVYHANKSIGPTFIEIRKRLNQLSYPSRLIASRNFVHVINQVYIIQKHLNYQQNKLIILKKKKMNY